MTEREIIHHTCVRVSRDYEVRGICLDLQGHLEWMAAELRESIHKEVHDWDCAAECPMCGGKPLEHFGKEQSA
jgi:hypothetical protein